MQGVPHSEQPHGPQMCRSHGQVGDSVESSPQLPQQLVIFCASFERAASIPFQRLMYTHTVHT